MLIVPAESFLAVPSSEGAWPPPMSACLLRLPRGVFSHLTNSLCALLGPGAERQVLPSDGCTPTFRSLKPGLTSRLLTMGVPWYLELLPSHSFSTLSLSPIPDHNPRLFEFLQPDQILPFRVCVRRLFSWSAPGYNTHAASSFILVPL